MTVNISFPRLAVQIDLEMATYMEIKQRVVLFARFRQFITEISLIWLAESGNLEMSIYTATAHGDGLGQKRLGKTFQRYDLPYGCVAASGIKSLR